MLRRIMLMVALLLPMFLGVTAGGVAQDATPGAGGEVTVLGPDESYAGRTRGEWDAQQWQWILSFPVDANPGLDPTGDFCGYGQSGPVFFLPGSFSPEPRDVTCIVPEGMAIFVALGSATCSTAEPPPYFGATEEELAACATASNDILTDVSVTINGQEVPDAMSYRTVSPMFPLTFGENNLYEAPVGVANAVSDSYNIIIAPPPPGEYVIVTTLTIEGEPEPFVGTIRVIVQAPQVIYPDASPVASPAG